jgi:pSer/pThr/pTyr-binding forkhead associated (FHA) protein
MVPNAFLIVNGLSTYPLTQMVINIGCDPTNQLVLEDPRVSRMHAQLRFITDRFVIFDLDSKEGTFVNGVSITSHVLNPGDVIMLAGVPLVYGQETSSQLGYTQELPTEPPTPEVL